jgi:hypothetical protein
VKRERETINLHFLMRNRQHIIVLGGALSNLYMCESESLEVNCKQSCFYLHETLAPRMPCRNNLPDNTNAHCLRRDENSMLSLYRARA